MLAAEHGRIFAVGDDDQSVYSWRGSDLAYIRRFTKDFPGATQIKLEENFRSTGHILDAANAVIARDRRRIGKTLFTCKPAGDRIEVVTFRNAEAEAIGIVVEMQRRHAEGVALGRDGGALPQQRAVARLRGGADACAHPLRAGRRCGLLPARRDQGHAGVAADGRHPGRPAIRRGAPARDQRARARLRRPRRWRSWRQKRRGVRCRCSSRWRPPTCRPSTRRRGWPSSMRSAASDAIATATLADQISLLLDATGYRAMLRESRAETTEGRLENVQELIQLAGGFHTARELLDHAALSTGGPNEDETERVRLMTLHKAKGLEFRHVFLPAWEAGTFPAGLWRPRRGAAARLCGNHPRHAARHDLALRLPPRLHHAVLFLDDIPDAAPCRRLAARGPPARPARCQHGRPRTLSAGPNCCAGFTALRQHRHRQANIGSGRATARPPPQGCVAHALPCRGAQRRGRRRARAARPDTRRPVRARGYAPPAREAAPGETGRS